MTLGWFGEDLVDGAKKGLNAFGGAVSDAADGAWDLVDDLPGLKQLGEGVKALATSEEFRDFARSAHGQIFFRALATVAGQGFGSFLLGPLGYHPLTILAMASAHSLPGVMRGQRFGDAFLAENIKRVDDTAKILGSDAAAALPQDWQRALDELQARARAFAPDLLPAAALDELAALLGTDAEGLARGVAAKLGVREDMAGQALALILDRPVLDVEAYDVATGRKLGAPRPLRFVARSTAATVQNEALARTLDVLDPARAYRAAARSDSATVENRSAGLALFRAERPALERAAGGVAEPSSPNNSRLLLLGVVVAASVGAAVWYARR